MFCVSLAALNGRAAASRLGMARPIDRVEQSLQARRPRLVRRGNPGDAAEQVGTKPWVLRSILRDRTELGCVVQERPQRVVLGSWHVDSLVEHEPGEVLPHAE